MPLNAAGYKVAYSLNKQSDIKTAVSDAQIDQMRGVQDFAPVTVDHVARVGDRAHFGKGDQFATYDVRTQRLYRVNAAAQPITDLAFAFGAGFVFGDVASIQPDAIGLPATWQHTFTLQDLAATTVEKPYTTLLEEFGGGTSPGYRRKLTGVTLNEINLSGAMGALAQLSFSGFARKYATEGTATLPAAQVTSSLYKVQRADIKLGPNPSSSLAAKWVAFELGISSNAAPVYRAGQTAGETDLIERADANQHDVSGTITVELDDTLRGYMENQTEIELILTLSSDDQVDSVDKTIVITIPGLLVAAESFSLEGRTVLYGLQFDPESVLKKSGQELITAVLTTGEIDDTELLVQNP